MRRVSIVATLSVLLVVLMAGALPAGADSSRGFVLVGSSGAHADLFGSFNEDATENHIEVAVGYVEADLLRYFDGEMVRPHTDVDARLCVYTDWCGSESSMLLEGTKNLPWDGDAEMLPLEAATLDGFRMTVVADGVEVALLIDLSWEGFGDWWLETHHTPESHSVGKFRAANLSGTITIESVTGDTPLVALVGVPLHVQVELQPFADSMPRLGHGNGIEDPRP